MSRCLRLLLLLFLIAGFSDAQTPAPQPALFQFQSNFWVNLHDILYQHAQTPQCLQGEINGECAHYFDMSVTEEDAWRQAVNWYAANLAKRNLPFDDEMIRINNVLSDLAPDANLDHRGLPEALVDALRTAAPVYRKYYWPDQDYWNRKWIEAETPRLERFGAQIAQQLAQIYGEQWPATPMRVDLVAFGGRTGAYTTLGPAHIVISSVDRRDQGDSGFEILFHEASHALVGKLWDQFAQAFKARNKRQPQDLWHVLLFYTTGELVRRVVPGYTSYADRNGLYINAWARFRELLDRDWKPFLDGKTDRETAIAKLAAEY